MQATTTQKDSHDLEKCVQVDQKAAITDQSSRLPFKQLMVVFAGLQISLFISFLDQTSVSTISPVIGDALKTSRSISWVGSSYLVATTSFQIIYGRMSDIFGRKQALLFAISIFGLGNLLCGFAQTAIWLFITRGISGIGAGGINSLVMIILSDIVTMEERGKYQGLIGCAVAVGSGIGPLIGGAFTEHASWRWVFWFSVPISLCSVVQIATTLPLTKVSGGYIAKLKKVDWTGCILSLGSIILLLVPISGGGNTYAWNSTMVISTITIGGLLAVAFVLWEWRCAALPIMPLRLFKNQVVGVVFAQTFLTGIIYYGNLYYLPLYYQNVLGMTATTSGLFILPLVLVQTASSITCGQITSKTGRMVPQIAVGFALWTVGAGLESTFSYDTPHAKLVGYLIIQGIGVGCTLQTSLVAAQCAAAKADRAVVTGTRNFFRTMGGAVGLTIAGAILDNLLEAELDSIPGITHGLKTNVVDNGLTKLGGTISNDMLAQLRRAYMNSIYKVFVMFIAVAGVAFLMCALMKDVKITTKEPLEKSQREDGVAGVMTDAKEQEG